MVLPRFGYRKLRGTSQHRGRESDAQADDCDDTSAIEQPDGMRPERDMRIAKQGQCAHCECA